MWILSNTINSFLIAFPALFSIVNPIGGALIYSQVTAGRSHPERVKLAWQVAGYSTGVMLISLWAGATLISFFGVTLSALRVAGGLVVAVRAWDMLSAPEQNEDRKQEQAAPAADASSDVAFFPLTMPFTTGPGTISVAIALSANQPSNTLDLVPFFAGLSGAAIAVAVTIGLCYAAADRGRRSARQNRIAGGDADVRLSASLYRRADLSHRIPGGARSTARISLVM